LTKLAQVQFHTADPSFEGCIGQFIILKLFSISHVLNYLNTLAPVSEQQPMITLPRRLLTMNSELRKYEKSRLMRIKVAEVFILDSGDLAIQAKSVKNTQTLLTFSSSWLDELVGRSIISPYACRNYSLVRVPLKLAKTKEKPKEAPNFAGKSKIRTEYTLSIDDIIKNVIEFEHPLDALKAVCEGLLWKGKLFNCKFYTGPRDDLVFSNAVGMTLPPNSCGQTRTVTLRRASQSMWKMTPSIRRRRWKRSMEEQM
jgi:hypothetical protein